MKKKAVKPPRPTSAYPEIPSSLQAPGGKVKVTFSPADVSLRMEDGTEVWGYWDEGKREVRVSRAPNARQQWKVYYHELAHVAITDAGLDNLLSNDLHEALCDAVATQRMRERFG